jgi:hypothetical protein
VGLQKVIPGTGTLNPIHAFFPPFPLPAGMLEQKGWFGACVKLGTLAQAKDSVWTVACWGSPDDTYDRFGFLLAYWRLYIEGAVVGGGHYAHIDTGWNGIDIPLGPMPSIPPTYTFVGCWDDYGNRCAVAVAGVDNNLSDNDSGAAGNATQVDGYPIIDIGNQQNETEPGFEPSYFPLDGDIYWVAMGNAFLSDADGNTVLGLGSSVPSLGQLPPSALAVWTPPKASAISGDTGTVAAISPDVVPQGLAPSSTLFPSPTLYPGGARTGLLPVTPRSGGVLAPILPDFE